MRRNTILVAAAGFCAGLLLMFLLYHYGAVGQKKEPVPTTKATVSVAKQEMPKQETPVCMPKAYVSKPGDSLWKIAGREWGGRSYFWPVLLEFNDIPNPNLILVGQALIIPCLCDLPTLTEEQVVKSVAKRVVRKATKVAAPLPCPECPECPQCPKTEAAPIASVTPSPEPTAVQPAPVVVTRPIEQKPAPVPVVQAKPQLQPAPPVVDKDLVPPEYQSYHGDRDELSGTNTGVPVAKQDHQGHARGGSEREAPGSSWNLIGTSPIEKNNWIDYFHIDQGIVVGNIGKIQIVPYIGFNAVADTKGYQWNNRLQGEAGLKLIRPLRSGVIEVGSAYAVERRYGNEPTKTKTGVIGFAGGWHGWHLPSNVPSPRKLFPGTLPGTFQWRVGNTSPFERNNVIAVTRMEQGFTLAKFGRVSIIPTGAIQVGADSDKNPWNRRYMYGGGLKVAVPWKSGIVDVQGGYMCAKQYAGTPLSRMNSCGPAISLNFWTGWGRR